MSERIDVVGIGNAIVDVLAHVEDAYLVEQGATKASMELIDGARAESLYRSLAGATECSGGSAANTMAGIVSLGGRAAYLGKVADDELGKSFRKGMREVGVAFETSPLVGEAATARCIVLVTDDAQRTMLTFLGASALLRPVDIDRELVAAAEITYLEGYLYDSPEAKRAFVEAAEAAHGAGRRVALSLSDSFCVARHLEAFRELVAGHVDVLFANEDEITALYGTEDFSAALAAVREHCAIAALTRGAQGAVIAAPDGVHEIPAAPVAKVVDTTGAGDLFAAGFLYGLTHGHDPAHSGRLGALASSEIISHFGARPETPLRELAGDLL